ncbi:MAG: DUF2693 domain-containing protein [Euryarchaeota archaeon]|jgi:hypothetical protein|nr:DUF2693 domain-containing protein [Euryarchaeota archaeon]
MKYKVMMIDESVEKDLSREDVVELLQNDVATVTFTKVDGTERAMSCTLLQEVLSQRAPIVPADKPQKPPKAPNPNTVAVFDMKANGWRSFRLDSVKSIEFPDSIFTDEGISYPTL